MLLKETILFSGPEEGRMVEEELLGRRNSDLNKSVSTAESWKTKKKNRLVAIGAFFFLEEYVFLFLTGPRRLRRQKIRQADSRRVAKTPHLYQGTWSLSITPISSSFFFNKRNRLFSFK